MAVGEVTMTIYGNEENGNPVWLQTSVKRISFLRGAGRVPALTDRKPERTDYTYSSFLKGQQVHLVRALRNATFRV